MESLEVVYDTLTYFKIMHWVKKAGKDEISGFGKVVREGKTLKVIDAMLLPQKNGRGHTDIEAADVGKAEYELRNTEGEMRLWWHSHVQMGCFWSTTDTDTIKALGQHGWILATVFNQKWQHRSAVYYGGELELFLDDLPFRHVYSLTPDQEAPWNEEFKLNVEAHRPKERTYRAVDAFREWKMKNLSKREKKIIAVGRKAVGDEELLAIFDTEHYGRFLYRKSTDRDWRYDVTHKDNPGIKVSVTWRELMEDITEVRWANDFMTSRFYWAAQNTSYKNQLFEEMANVIDEMEAREEMKRLPPGSQSELATRIGNGNGTPGGIILPNDEDEFMETEKAMRRIYGDWDKKPEEEKETLRFQWESGEMPWIGMA